MQVKQIRDITRLINMYNRGRHNTCKNKQPMRVNRQKHESEWDKNVLVK